MQVLARWPREEPVVALISGGRSPRSRWSVLARPGRTIVTPALADAPRLLEDLRPLEASFQGVGPGVGWLGAMGAVSPAFTTGWIGWLSYHVGQVLEPAVGGARRSDWPLMVWHRVDGSLAHDATTGAWWRIGNAPVPRLEPAREAGRAALRQSFVAAAPEEYQAIVERGLELIRSGDVYQVNLAHAIEGHLAVTPRRFAAALLERARPWYGAFVEHAGPDGRGRALCSASPESLLEIDAVRGSGAAARRVVTRPMKGTLPGGSDPAGLARSAKDTAELDMIVDLMRNDLGRICQVGSVRVEDRRVIERHGGGATPDDPGVWQGVATVAGLVRPRLGLDQVLRAMVPAGSVTGVPKIRAMQVIESLEARPRGPYCGCVGFIGDDGRTSLNVAIRTALLEPGAAPDQWLASYSVGAGIVADSDPVREWHETMHKARTFLGLSARDDATPSGYLIQSG